MEGCKLNFSVVYLLMTLGSWEHEVTEGSWEKVVCVCVCKDRESGNTV